MTPFVKSLVLLSGTMLAAQQAGAQAVAPQHLAQADGGAAPTQAGSDTAQSRNAARSRMRECGHQWSSMKKNGSAAGTTWKDFSQSCLAHKP